MYVSKTRILHLFVYLDLRFQVLQLKLNIEDICLITMLVFQTWKLLPFKLLAR